jgi:hypothetical protein
MNPRTLINFFKRPVGRFLGFLLLFAVALGLAYGCRSRQSPSSDLPPGSKKFIPKSHTWPVTPLPTNRPAGSAPTESAPPPPPVTPPEIPTVVTGIGIHQSEHPPEPELADFLPYGQLLPCVLVFSAETSQQGTPLIGLVTEDVCFNRRIIVPKGTGVHGRGQPGRLRDRIISDGNWVLVWPTGEELVVSGMALHQARDTNGLGWQRDDGSPGLPGELVKTDHTAELKVFGAAFLTGAAEVFKDRSTTIYGDRVVPSARNGALAGGEAVLQSYAQQIAESIQRDGVFVQVIAGSEFYLYVTQTLDRSQATLAGSRRREAGRPVTTNSVQVPKNR